MSLSVLDLIITDLMESSLTDFHFLIKPQAKATRMVAANGAFDVISLQPCMRQKYITSANQYRAKPKINYSDQL
jgi:hypothetical protein